MGVIATSSHQQLINFGLREISEGGIKSVINYLQETDSSTECHGYEL